MPKRKQPELSTVEQSQRFRELAKQSETDNSGAKFDKAFLSIARTRPPHKTKAKKRTDDG